jgi:MICOS complex subunit MIC60
MLLLLRPFPRCHSSTTTTTRRYLFGSDNSSLVATLRLPLSSIAAVASCSHSNYAASSSPVGNALQLQQRRTMLTTGRQKRAMEAPSSSSSSSASAPPRPPLVSPPSSTAAAAAAATPAVVSGGRSGGGSSGAMVQAALVGLTTVGAAYYYFNVYAPHVDEVKVKVKAARKEQVTEAAEAAVDLGHAVTHKEEEEEEEQPTVTEESSGNDNAETNSSSSSSEQRKLSRVVTIAIPPSMQNKASAVVVEEEEQPASTGGHRVLMRPSVPMDTTLPEESGAAAEAMDQPAAVTRSAREELQQTTSKQAEEQTLSLLASHQSLVSASAMTSDLDQLSPSQLQVRVVQLATELQDRTKWEAVRLKEFLAMKERETADQYLQVLQRQRLEFEDVLAQRLRQLQTEHYQAMQATIAQKDAQVQAVLDAALQAQAHEHEQDKDVFVTKTRAEVQAQVEKEYFEKMLSYQAQVARDLQSKVQQLEKMSQNLKLLENALISTQTSQAGSVMAHRLSAAALALSEKLQGNASAAKELHALQLAISAQEKDGVIATAVASLPLSIRQAASRSMFGDDDLKDDVGVPTVAELQTRFEESVHPACRRAVLVPKGRPGLEGQLAGMLFSALKTAPSPDDVAPAMAMVSGGGDDADSSRSSNDQAAEYIVARARQHVRLGELEHAVEELDKLQGQAAYTVADWKRDAMDRIATNKALKVIKMECALLNQSLSENGKAATEAS